MANKIHEHYFVGEYTLEDINRESLKLKAHIKDHPETVDDFIVNALNLASLAVQHIMGFYPNATQIFAALLLISGKVVELRSGEGKTIVAALAAYWQVLNGRHVDIATTNDYLAERDRHWMSLVYGALGIEVGVIKSTTRREDRPKEYGKPITYAANQELGFDYLRDHLALDKKDRVLGELDFVIIDEADSILIDEARTPLIISEAGRERKEKDEFSNIEPLFKIVRDLTMNIDYALDYQAHTVALTDDGVKKIISRLGEDFFNSENFDQVRALWYVLYVSVFLKPDRDYMIKDGKVVLVDEFTGHAMPDRHYLDGVQQALEAKAGIALTPRDVITASITYRNLFKLYKGIAGMTGTAYDSREEFFKLYDLEVVPVAPYQMLKRKDLPTFFFRTMAEKMAKIVEIAQKIDKTDPPLLVVACSIEVAKEISVLLSSNNIEHQLLDAEVGEKEFEIIENAGQPGVITVATNMAGRGADIIVDASLRFTHGLSVLGSEHNRSHRVDEQLRGRAGRQGQPGETIFLTSLEDELLQIYADDSFWNYAEKVNWDPQGVSDLELVSGLLRAQEKAQRIEAETRLSLARFDGIIDKHRQVTYKFRSQILEFPSYFEPVLEELRKIIKNETHASIDKSDLIKIIDKEAASYDEFKPIKSFVLDSVSLKLPKAIVSRDETVYNKLKEQLLLIIDSHWQEYLEDIEWLEAWISLTSAGGEDPYRIFIETADQMFHAMRKDLALLMLGNIINFIKL